MIPDILSDPLDRIRRARGLHSAEAALMAVVAEADPGPAPVDPGPDLVAPLLDALAACAAALEQGHVTACEVAVAPPEFRDPVLEALRALGPLRAPLDSLAVGVALRSIRGRVDRAGRQLRGTRGRDGAVRWAIAGAPAPPAPPT